MRTKPQSQGPNPSLECKSKPQCPNLGLNFQISVMKPNHSLAAKIHGKIMAQITALKLKPQPQIPAYSLESQPQI